ncbi:MAG: TlpA family protein disulfide reductase [Alphaproteobacteria bacterium]|nr:TlpA family protein disulfide reductase [Alphaproteobacteria bacterium]
MSRRTVAAGCLLLVMATGGLAQASEAIVVGKPAPNFHAQTFTGQKVSLADYRGEVLIVNYWATWCGPCRKELPLLDSYLRAQSAHGMRVLAVTDENSLPLGQLKPLSKMVSFDMAWRFSGPYDHPHVFPTNYVIDRNGVVRYAEAGAFDLDTLNRVIVPLLNAPPPPAPAPHPAAQAAAQAAATGEPVSESLWSEPPKLR